MKREDLYFTLNNLSEQNFLLYTILSTERITHFYEYFCDLNKIYNFIDSKNISMDYLDFLIKNLYSYLLGDKKFKKLELKEISEELTFLTPDTDIISDSEIVLSQNSIISLAYIYDYLLEKNMEILEDSLFKIEETLDVIQENELSNKQIDIAVDYEKQIHFIEKKIKTIEVIDEKTINNLRDEITLNFKVTL